MKGGGGGGGGGEPHSPRNVGLWREGEKREGRAVFGLLLLFLVSSIFTFRCSWKCEIRHGPKDIIDFWEKFSSKKKNEFSKAMVGLANPIPMFSRYRENEPGATPTQLEQPRAADGRESQTGGGGLPKMDPRRVIAFFFPFPLFYFKTSRRQWESSSVSLTPCIRLHKL